MQHARTTFDSAREAYANGDLDLALTICEKAIAGSPGDLRLKFLRALILQAGQNHPAAISELTEVLATATGPFEVPALYARACSYNEINQFTQVEEDTTRILELDAEHHDAQYLRCVALNALGSIEPAIELATGLLVARPDYHEALVLRAKMFYALEDWQRAVEDFTFCLEHPGVAESYMHDVYFFRGVCNQNLGQHDSALDDLSRAIEIKPDHAPSYARRSIVYSSLNRHDLWAQDIDQCKKLVE